ncbi:MAG: sugar phosphate isomerase/epimerase [Victivallales bacterium]|nr:sugar phosphate isomerase/epimerase [Victivallales bacterium]
MTIKIGTIISILESNYRNLFRKLVDFGLHTCQICNWNVKFYDTDYAEKVASVKQQMKDLQVAPSAVWAGYSGLVCWNFTEGPVTMGLVPEDRRQRRVEDLKCGARFAADIGVRAIITHCGFLPENMTDANFNIIRCAIYDVASYCKSLGIGFWFETGQETPVALLRMIQAVEAMGLDNLGINLDPANLLLYGKGNPCDALNVFGKYVHNIHVKDGFVPTTGTHLGKEAQVGQGMVNFPVFVKKLLSIGFQEEFIIEREIPEGEQQTADIRETIKNLHLWAGE